MAKMLILVAFLCPSGEMKHALVTNVPTKAKTNATLLMGDAPPYKDENQECPVAIYKFLDEKTLKEIK